MSGVLEKKKNWVVMGGEELDMTQRKKEKKKKKKIRGGVGDIGSLSLQNYHKKKKKMS